jgi:hypothetical protein
LSALSDDLAGIATYFRITAAVSESPNAKIQWVKYTACGFRNEQHFVKPPRVVRRCMHKPIAQTGPWLRSIVQGCFNYHAAPGNTDSLSVFRCRVIRLWRTLLIHRGQ